MRNKRLAIAVLNNLAKFNLRTLLLIKLQALTIDDKTDISSNLVILNKTL